MTRSQELSDGSRDSDGFCAQAITSTWSTFIIGSMTSLVDVTRSTAARRRRLFTRIASDFRLSLVAVEGPNSDGGFKLTRISHRILLEPCRERVPLPLGDLGEGGRRPGEGR